MLKLVSNGKCQCGTCRSCRGRESEHYRAQARERRRLEPEKAKARDRVTSAVLFKRLKKQPCSVCGALHAQAHHHDYSKPLDVEWLCSIHHGQAHQRAERLGG